MKTKLSVVELVVDDMARSLAFYRQLGLDLPAEADQQPHVDIELPGGMRIAWDTVETIHSFDPDWRPPSGGGGRMSLAFGFDTPAEVDSAYKKLVSLDYDGYKEPWDAFWGMRYAVVHDPDGNGIDLFSPNS